MQAREDIVISAAGTPGFHANDSFPWRAATAEYGRRGEDGRSAAAPSAGTPGSDIRVRLSYAKEEPTTVQVGGEGGFTGVKWKVQRDKNLHLNVHGGDGGNGGRGENGQQGGQGPRGRDATKYHDATAGGMGAPGGNGGYGTNGADGADAGSVFITVHESDLDTLSCVTWDLSGGGGGLSGTHGQPGEGGIGGEGGSGGRWEHRSGDHTTYITRGPGAPGPQGQPGIPPATYLSGGRSGKNGSSQIRVIKGDLTEATYPRRYVLKVVSFDVEDENQDGINEPGEHILVRNIVVENIGGMPSPNMNRIRVLIHGTQWLQPVVDDPIVELPREIQVGAKVKVPGVLRALIRTETATRPSGKALFENDQVSLIATFDERLNRPLPEFNGAAPIEIQYPLVLSAPKCLDCVAKGDNVRFSWTVTNISTKEYGLHGALQRHAGTRLSDPARIFELRHGGGQTFADDNVDVIKPREELYIDQDFMVSSSALEYSDGVLTLDLMLSDPSKQNMQNRSPPSARSVMKHDIKMQVSGRYEYKEKSRFLLVVNSGTPNYAIHQTINFIRNSLHLEVDIFNISLTGSFIVNDDTKENVLTRYEGKSIIIHGSTFAYFRMGHRNPWDLLDPWEVSRLAKNGTSFLFASVGNANELQNWGTLMAFPTPMAAVPSSLDAESVGALIESLKSSRGNGLESTHFYHKFAAKKRFFSNLESSMSSHSKSATKKLNKTFPLRRFVTRPNIAGSGTGATSSVVVSEGLPKTAKVFATKLPHPPNTVEILDYHMYAIVACLPFQDQAHIFWNLAGQWDNNGLPSSLVYNGIPHLLNSKPGDPMKEKVTISVHELIGVKVFQAICLSLESQLGTEITRYCDKPSWWYGGNPIATKDVLNQLPLLRTFLTVAPAAAPISSTERTEFLVGTLGTITGALLPIGGLQFCSNYIFPIKIRKAQLRPQVRAGIMKALSNLFTQPALSALQKSIDQTAKDTKKLIKASGQADKNLSLVTLSRLSQFTGTNNAMPDDLTVPNDPSVGGSVAWERGMLENNRRTHDGKTKQRLNDEAQATAVIAEHVNPENEDDEEPTAQADMIVTAAL